MSRMFDSVEEAVEEIRNGKMVIVTDDENRENEGKYEWGQCHATDFNRTDMRWFQKETMGIQYNKIDDNCPSQYFLLRAGQFCLHINQIVLRNIRP